MSSSNAALITGASAGIGAVYAGLLAKPARVGRELVPEPIEVNSLPSGDEPFGVRTLEGEMPEGAAANDLVPMGRRPHP